MSHAIDSKRRQFCNFKLMDRSGTVRKWRKSTTSRSFSILDLGLMARQTPSVGPARVTHQPDPPEARVCTGPSSLKRGLSATTEMRSEGGTLSRCWKGCADEFYCGAKDGAFGHT